MSSSLVPDREATKKKISARLSRPPRRTSTARQRQEERPRLNPQSHKGGALSARERILSFGKEGAGKSYTWLTVAEALPEVPFYCLDTDDAVDRLMEEEFPDVRNVLVYPVTAWPEFEAAAKEVSEISKPRDGRVLSKQDLPWLVVDMSDVTWDFSQKHFTEEVFNKGIDQYFLEVRKAMSSTASRMEAFEGWTDWQVINKIFQSTWDPLTRMRGCNLFLTAKAQRANKEAKDFYSGMTVMPSGEKRMGHRVHSVLYMSGDSRGWYVTTAKDRGRTRLERVKVGDFYSQYLVEVAGWPEPK